MCDTYSGKCAGGCGKLISLHIADFCTNKDNVHAYCPSCITEGKLIRKEEKTNEYYVKQYPDNPEFHKTIIYKGIKAEQVFIEFVEAEYQIGEEIDGVLKPTAKVGDVVVIIVDDPNAYGIHLN